MVLIRVAERQVKNIGPRVWAALVAVSFVIITMIVILKAFLVVLLLAAVMDILTIFLGGTAWT